MPSPEDLLEEFALNVCPQAFEEPLPNPRLDPCPTSWDPEEWASYWETAKKTIPWDDPELRVLCINKLVQLGASEEYATDLVDRSTQEFFDLVYEASSKEKHIGPFMRMLLKNGGYVLGEQIYKQSLCHTRRVSDIEDRGLLLDREYYNGGLKYTLSPERFVRMREGRLPWTKAEKKLLFKEARHQCVFCPPQTAKEDRCPNPQCDHKIPYRIAGNSEVLGVGMLEAVQVLCPTHNTAKQIICKSCDNHKEGGDPEVCKRCYWYGEPDYDHVACRPERLLTLRAKTPDDVELLKSLSPDEALEVLRRHVEKPRLLNAVGV